MMLVVRVRCINIDILYYCGNQVSFCLTTFENATFHASYREKNVFNDAHTRNFFKTLLSSS